MKTFKTNVSFLTLFLILIISTNTFAQDESPAEEKEEPKFSFAGSIDTYFHSSLNTEESAPATSFANYKGFSLGMANLIASYAGDKVGFTADVVFGPRGVDAVFGPTIAPSATTQRIINQLYAYYKFSKSAKLILGQFNTFVGMETITPVPNTHYSTSYLFTNGPFNHTGLRLDIDTESGFGAKLALMNPTDVVEFNPFGTYTLGVQLGITKDNGGAYLNFLYGDPDGNDAADSYNVYGNLFQADLTTSWNLGEKFSLGANASYRNLPYENSSTGKASSFAGIALYPKLTITENFVLALRAEHFAVKNGYPPLVTPFGLDANGKGSVTEFTLSGNLTSGSLRIIPEIRLDNMSEDTYLVKDTTTGELTKSMLSFNLAAIYSF